MAKTQAQMIAQIEEWLTTEYQFRRNSITRMIQNNGCQFEAADFNTVYIAANKKFGKVQADLIERLIHSHFTPTFNPIIDFIEQNKHVHLTGRLNALFDTIMSEDYEFARYFGTKWYVSMIASVFGKHSRQMLILSGTEQNTGKTEWFRRLLPEPLLQYYAESKLDAGKDDELLMTQKLIVMDDEMGGKSKKDEKRLKELLSRQSFSLREPYGRHNIDLTRLAVLCGTTNDELLLSDPTGNSRLIPIHVQSINQRDYNSVNKTEVFIEAYHLYASGYQYWLTRDDVDRLNQGTDRFENYSAEYELIRQFFRPCKQSDPAAQDMSATQVKNYLETHSVQKLSLDRIGKELHRLGFFQSIKRIDKSTSRVYHLAERLPTAQMPIIPQKLRPPKQGDFDYN